jgi:hypothetical protein
LEQRKLNIILCDFCDETYQPELKGCPHKYAVTCSHRDKFVSAILALKEK